MSVIEMQKIRLIAGSNHRQKLLDTLQSEGVMEITEISSEDNVPNEANLSPDKMDKVRNAELNIANIEFALKLISPFAKHRNLLQGPLTLSIDDVRKKAQEFSFNKIIKKCREIEETIVALRNEHAALVSLQKDVEPWQGLSTDLNNIGETQRTITMLGTIQKITYDDYIREISEISSLINIEKVEDTVSSSYLVLTFAKELEKQIREVNMNNKFSEVELPASDHDAKKELANIKIRKSEIEKELGMQNEELKVVAKDNDDLQIVHDYFVWERDKIYANQKSLNTEYSFTLEGWVPLKGLDEVKKKLIKITKAFEIYELELEEGEQAPVAIKNKGLLGSFEAVTNIYGLPLPNEVDPTPFLAGFFIIFFGLCLTDAGYGIILFVTCGLALKFLKLPEGMHKLVKLLMLGGIVTFILGALFGGWFGMTPDQAPAFLTFDKMVDGEMIKAFRWQIITPAEGAGPLTFLALAAVLGYIQVLFGVLIDGFWKIKKKRYLDAILDSFLWFYFLVIMGLFGLSATGAFLGDYAGIITNLVWLGVIALVLTQGRKQKNIVLKFLTGVLSLYGLVGYFADVLSYSRLMALGLGTGIIGFAFNTIGGLVAGIPYVGIIFAIIVIIIGHTLNIAISTLGAYIHSSRLQFVEFFGKFMEGGGKPWKPLQKACKYILITEK